MLANSFFYIIIAILVLGFLAERWLDYLNSTWWSDDLPPELSGIYNEEKYRKSQQYLKTRVRFSTLVDSLTFIATLSILVFGGFAWLDGLLRQMTANPIVLALSFFGIIGLASSLLAIPFEYYAVFVIEEKFGFNTMTTRTFILDKLKGWILAALLGGGLLSLIVWIYNSTGNLFWIIVWTVVSAFMIFMTMFYSNLIVPLFNKQTPLEAGSLRDAIEAFASKVGFRIKNIYVIDGSRRSKKANAYFTGLGMKKRIVLFDTLIKDHTNDELVAVLAHEIGHYKMKHTTKGVIMSLFQTGLMLFILSLFIAKGSALADALCSSLAGFGGFHVVPGFHLGVLAFGLLYSPLSLLIGLLENYISRKHEFQADNYAGTKYDPVALQDALKKLSVNNLSNLRPHPAYVFFYYSHPPLMQRLAILDKINSGSREG